MKRASQKTTRSRSASIFAVIGVLALTIAASFAGHGVGNGGDHVRATFMQMGDAVLAYLQETAEGQKIIVDQNLQIADLKAVLDINVIEVQDGILIDNTGSAVDAIGVKDKITLAKDRWNDHFENDRDVYFLVFHEMLRAVQVNDDNYIISKAISPFPAARRIVTRIASIYPLLGEISLDKLIAIDRMQLDGDGCPRLLAGTFADFDLEKNVLNVALQRYDLALNGTTATRKSCTILLPVNPPAGKKLTVTQIDFAAKTLLSAGTTAVIASDVSYGASLIPAFTKSYTASGDTRGRLLARSHQAVSSNCKGNAELLKIRTAATMQKSQILVQPVTVNRLIADGISISFAVENCAK